MTAASTTNYSDFGRIKHERFEEREQLQDTGPFLKAFRFGGSFGSAVDEKNEE